MLFSKLKIEEMNNFYEKVLCFLIIFSLPYLSVDAQQLPIFNQNKASLNPAYISSGYFKYNTPTTASIRYRHQWTEVKDAPRTLLATFSHLDEENSFSYGGDFISDQTGPTGFIGVYGRANYGIQLTNDFILSFGFLARRFCRSKVCAEYPFIFERRNNIRISPNFLDWSHWFQCKRIRNEYWSHR